MKNLIISILCLLSFTTYVVAQEYAEFKLNSHIWSLNAGSLTLTDTYLSPLPYKGSLYEWNVKHTGFYKSMPQKLSWNNQNNLGFGLTTNPSKTATVYYIQGSIGFGTEYHFRPAKNLILQIGGLTQINIAGKINDRNVNNPASVDAAFSNFITGSVRYNLQIRRFFLGMQYEIQTPVFGCMFVPEAGSLYYEMRSGNMKNCFHFTSFHNNCGIKGKVSLDFIMKNFTLRTGFIHDYQTWHANNLNFNKESYSFSIGTIIDLIYKSGEKAFKYNPIWQ